MYQLSARLDAAHMSIASLQHSSRACADALTEARGQHASEIERMSHLHEAICAAAAREAASAEAQRLGGRCTALEAQVRGFCFPFFLKEVVMIVFCSWST